MRKTLIAEKLKLGVIGLGCMSMSHGYSPAERDDEESIEVVHRALELGITLFDTADIYGPYTNEELLGRGLAGRREQALIATKCGLVPLPGGKLTRNGRPEFIREACERSLARLGTDVIDLYQLHRVDPEVPLEETWGAMGDLVAEGKVRALGISHATVSELDRIHAVFPVTAVQYELSVWARGTRDDVLPWCRANEAAFLAFSPLGRGYLSGVLDGATFGVDDSRSRDPRFTSEAMSANRAIVRGLHDVAERIGATPAQVAVAWVLAQDEKVVPIPGTKKVRWLEENAAAAELELSERDLKEIEALPDPMGDMKWT
ncbi:aldo/keto reductase [Actinosynnema sp. NPDC023587]|uniref:aldo/keto reductase n=1 Tax=Actinosynnema sp. NPDC023587 TaxID=3154695 RepID=UPI0033D68F2C